MPSTAAVDRPVLSTAATARGTEPRAPVSGTRPGDQLVEPISWWNRSAGRTAEHVLVAERGHDRVGAVEGVLVEVTQGLDEVGVGAVLLGVLGQVLLAT